jgi:hypothetical protein
MTGSSTSIVQNNPSRSWRYSLLQDKSIFINYADNVDTTIIIKSELWKKQSRHDQAVTEETHDWIWDAVC